MNITPHDSCLSELVMIWKKRIDFYGGFFTTSPLTRLPSYLISVQISPECYQDRT